MPKNSPENPTEVSLGRSVLKNLERTIDVPRVHLRDADRTSAEPIEKPDSPEIPRTDADTRYRLDGEIARGGMGTIIKGRDNDLGRDLAIKVLLDEHRDRPEVIQRFIEEAQIGGQLQHPGIAPIYELGQFADQRPFFSMKLVKGATLSKLLTERKAQSEDRVRFLGIFEQVCQTMGYAHLRGVIHRDLKPANIMVGAFGEVQVMDWGLAKVLPSGGVADEKNARSKHKDDITVLQTRRSTGSDIPGLGSGSGSADTQMGSVMGTPAYMPPEQALGEIDQLDQRSDVFGLGAILCEILTGQPPYVGEDATSVFRLASRGDLQDAHHRLDECGADPELIALTKESLASRPNERPKDGGALAEQITGYLESVEAKLRQSEVERASEAARAIEQKKRLRLTLAMAAVVLLALGLGVAGTTWGLMEARNQAALALDETRQKDEALQSEQKLTEFLQDVFKSPNPGRMVVKSKSSICSTTLQKESIPT